MLRPRSAQGRVHLGPQLCSWLEILEEVYLELLERGFFLLSQPDIAGTGPGLAGTEETPKSHVTIFNSLREAHLCSLPLAQFLLHSPLSLMSTYPTS